jgi:hypothetical protein
MGRWVEPSHRRYFAELMTYFGRHPEFRAIERVLLPLAIVVINDMQPTMPHEDFAEELGNHVVISIPATEPLLAPGANEQARIRCLTWLATQFINGYRPLVR